MSSSRAESGTMAGLLVILSLVGAWHMGNGVWIYLKAQLAQVLLQRAWAGTTDGQQEVKPWPWADTWPVARLTVPTRNIDLIVQNGAYGRTLAFGPGYLESSATPGSIGTTILSGHRDTHFRFLQRLKEGDEILLTSKNRQLHRYRVNSMTVVDARLTSIEQGGKEHQLALVTCYPFDAIRPGGPLRYVVMAEEIERRSEEGVSEGGVSPRGSALLAADQMPFLHDPFRVGKEMDLAVDGPSIQ
ncbi:MAG: class GN sortase [Nitrospirota bacterium]